MYGIALIGSIFLWWLLTIIATVIGWKIGKSISPKLWVKALAALIGFMPFMGFFMLKWTIYFFIANANVDYLCRTEGGLKVYVTPEEYRKEVGEEEWKKLYFLQHDNIPDQFNKDNWVTFNGKRYQPSTKETHRAWWFWVVEDRRLVEDRNIKKENLGYGIVIEFFMILLVKKCFFLSENLP